MGTTDHKITTCLWFDDQARDAAEFYTSLFPNSKIEGTTRFGKEGQEIHGKPEGADMTVSFELEGQKFTGLNGGPHFRFNPSVSLFVMEEESRIDELWKKLEKGGKILMPLDRYDWSDRYGWVQDRFGLNWQVMLDSYKNTKQKICPLLFFTGPAKGRAEEAIQCYTSIFKNSGVEGISRYSEEDPIETGWVKHAQFRILGETFMAMDGGPEHEFTFNEAVSFVVGCETQEEIDYYWDHLSEGGDEKAQQCGWLKDKFGVSWQIVPTLLHKMLNSENKTRTDKVTKAFLQMKKFNIQKLREAYDS